MLKRPRLAYVWFQAGHGNSLAALVTAFVPRAGRTYTHADVSERRTLLDTY